MKLIALDLDGTLLNHDGSISVVTSQHLRNLFQREYVIAIVTGRPFADTLYFLKTNGNMPKCGYPQYLICEERDIYTLESNGEYHPWLKRNEVLLESERSLLPVGNELAAMLEAHLNLAFFINNSVYQRSRGFVEILCATPEVARNCTKELDKLATGTALQPICNNQGISLRKRGIGKRHCLEELAAHLGLSHSEVLVMGDSFNDLAMLTAGFNAATTANSAQEIKDAVLSVGGYVSSLSMSDGVGEVLGKLLA